MARVKKDREPNIVHFSFFDLLFGAFGAFVFLMLMQVISTINLVGKESRQLVDDLVEEKSQLARQVDDAKVLQQQYSELKNQYEKAIAGSVQNQKDIDTYKTQNKNLSEDNARLTSEKSEMQSRLNEAQKGEINKNQLESKNKELEITVATLRHEIDGYKNINDELNAKGDVVRSLNAEIDRLKSELVSNQKDDTAEKKKLSDEIGKLNQQLADSQRKYNMAGSLADENKELKERLQDAEQQLGKLKIYPLEMEKILIPKLVTGDKIQLPISVKGGIPPYAHKVTGKIPDGLKMDDTLRSLIGTLKTTGKYNFSIEVTDQQGKKVNSGPINIEVVLNPVTKKGISKWFFVALIIAALYIFQHWWRAYKFNKYLKENDCEVVLVKKNK